MKKPIKTSDLMRIIKRGCESEEWNQPIPKSGKKGKPPQEGGYKDFQCISGNVLDLPASSPLPC
jgi:hypothetical protein